MNHRHFIYILFLFLSSCKDEMPLVLDQFANDLDIQIADLADIQDPESIQSIMKKVCAWQLMNPVAMNDGNGMAWARSAFYTGMMATYYTSQDQKYLDAAVKWASSKKWKLDERYNHPDDHACGQTYLEIYLLDPVSIKIADTKSTFDQLILENTSGEELYWWADALFMSPTVLARLYAATDDEKYLAAMNSWWWDSYDLLYDPSEDLFFQSHWFFNRKTPNGYKTFWARANGWVMAGTVRILDYLPVSNPYYEKFIDLHQAMSEKIASLQKNDGLWRPSLLDSLEAPYPETSSSGFFTYAMAWGINHGYLERNTYLPVVKKAWKGLVSAIHPDGRLGWVQPGGSQPDEVNYDDYQEFGTGAFLLAASEIYKLRLNE